MCAVAFSLYLGMSPPRASGADGSTLAPPDTERVINRAIQWLRAQQAGGAAESNTTRGLRGFALLPPVQPRVSNTRFFVDSLAQAALSGQGLTAPSRVIVRVKGGEVEITGGRLKVRGGEVEIVIDGAKR
jgi:hypothetical protein